MYLTHPAIDPILFRLGFLEIRWYSLMYIVGVILSYYWFSNEIQKGRLVFSKKGKILESKELLGDFAFYFMVGMMLGGRLGYVFLYNFSYYFLEGNFLAIFRIWEGGMSFHGAMLGIMLSLVLLQRNKAKSLASSSFLDFSDPGVIPVSLSLAFGRFGNFVNGELFGRPTDLPWAMLFPRRIDLGHVGGTFVPLDSVASIVENLNYELIEGVNMFIREGITYVNVPRHPSQLYEMVLEGIVICIILAVLYYRFPKISHRRGFLTGLNFMLYSIFRISVEFLREPDIHMGFLFGDWLTAGMLYSVPAFLFGAVWFARSFRPENLNPPMMRVVQKNKGG